MSKMSCAFQDARRVDMLEWPGDIGVALLLLRRCLSVAVVGLVPHVVREAVHVLQTHNHDGGEDHGGDDGDGVEAACALLGTGGEAARGLGDSVFEEKIYGKMGSCSVEEVGSG
jgi:hypothetical protein